MVLAGAGITLVSKWTAEPFAGPEIVVRPVKESLASRFAIIYPKGFSEAALSRAFAEELRVAMTS